MTERASLLLHVPLDDLALALHEPQPTTVERDGKHFCVACGLPAGAHYCAPRQAAVERLTATVRVALNAA